MIFCIDPGTRTGKNANSGLAVYENNGKLVEVKLTDPNLFFNLWINEDNLPERNDDDVLVIEQPYMNPQMIKATIPLAKVVGKYEFIAEKSGAYIACNPFKPKQKAPTPSEWMKYIYTDLGINEGVFKIKKYSYMRSWLHNEGISKRAITNGITDDMVAAICIGQWFFNKWLPDYITLYEEELKHKTKASKQKKEAELILTALGVSV